MRNISYLKFFILLACILPFAALAQEEGSINAFGFFENNSSVNLFEKIIPGKKGAVSRNINFNEQRLAVAEKNGNTKAVASLSTNLGGAWLQRGDFEKAIVYYNKSVIAFKLLNDSKGTAFAAARLAFAYDQSGNKARALELYNKSAEALKPLNLHAAVSAVYGLAGIIYLQQNDSAKASDYFNIALAALNNADNKPLRANLLNKIGEVYLSKNNYPKALEFFRLFLKISEAAGNKQNMAIALRNTGIVYFKKGDYEKAEEYFKRSLSYSNNILVKKLLKDAYLKNVTVSSFKKDFERADKYHEMYRQLKDELRMLENNKDTNPQNLAEELKEKEKIIDMLSRQNEEQNKILTQQDYELSQQLTATEIERQSKEKALEELNITEQQKQQKQLELDKITKEKALQELELSRKEVLLAKSREYRNILIFASALILFAAFFILNRYRYKKRSLDELNKTHEELNQAHMQLKAAQLQLIHSEKMASLGQLTAGIAHEIQNPLNFVNNFSKLSLETITELKETTDEQSKKELADNLYTNLEKINHHGHRISEIVKGMLQHSRNDSGEKSDTDLNALIADAANLAYQGKRSSEINFNCALEKALDKSLPPVKIMQQDFRRVILNFLNNAFDAVKEKQEMLERSGTLNGYMPSVNISTIKQGNNAAIIIRDNGAGIPENIRGKIFNPFFTSKPTGKGTGLGLSISYDIITKGHNGKVTLESEPGQGTTFFITLPLT